MSAVFVPAAIASSGGGIVPAGFLGLPSIHGIIEAIANGFFSALAKALVPSWLTHGTVATIQHLVALPDPAEWGHVGALQGEMIYLGAMLAPLTLTVTALRYWTVGLTGAAHPASALGRCAGATGVLVAYRWIVEEVVAGTNTLTHGLLGLPSVSAGLGRIIGVLFGGALLSGGGGVFGALLVIVGVIFAAGLFATQVLLTVALALLIVAGPPLIALGAIPELSHLARAWRDALMTIVLIPLGWTVLFATAGALCLDATSFTGGAGGLPGHVAAAFAGLITFALAVKLPLVLLGELRHVLSRSALGSGSASASSPAMPGTERVRSARARLRAVGLAGAPAIGASLGAAAGALGAPAGGPLGASRRRLSLAANGGGTAGSSSASGSRARPASASRRGVRERVAGAVSILARAPREAANAARTARRPAVVAANRVEGASSRGGRDGRADGQGTRGATPASEPRPAAPRSDGGGSPSRRSGGAAGPGRVTLAAVTPGRQSTTGGDRHAAASPPPRPPQMHAVSDGEQHSSTRAPARSEPDARSRKPPAARSPGTPKPAPAVRESSDATRSDSATPTPSPRPPRSATPARAKRGGRT